MTTRILDCSVSIGGVDFSSYVRSIAREHFICRPVGTATISVDPENAPACTPGAAVSISEMGTQRFTGAVSDVLKGHVPATYEIECQDEMKKLAEYNFVDTEIVSSGSSTISQWIEFFLQRVGISSYSVASTTDLVPAGITFQLESCMDIVKKLCNTQGWQMYADASGAVHIGDFMTQGVPTTISNTTRVAALQDDSWLRNKITVFGYGNAKGQYTQSIPELGTETREAVLANPYIPTLAAAQGAAERMAPYFATPLDTKEVVMEGGEQVVSLLDTVEFNDGYVGAHSGLVTGVESAFGSDGYLITYYLNERCPGFWGYWVSGVLGMYCSVYHTTSGSGGVYRTLNYQTWTDIGYNLVGDDRYIHAIGLNPFIQGELWACSADGLFKLPSSGSTWSQISTGAPSNDAGDSPAPAESDLVFVDIEFDRAVSGTFYVLARKKISNPPVRTWIFKTTTSGVSWSSYGVNNAGNYAIDTKGPYVKALDLSKVDGSLLRMVGSGASGVILGIEVPSTIDSSTVLYTSSSGSPQAYGITTEEIDQDTIYIFGRSLDGYPIQKSSNGGVLFVGKGLDFTGALACRSLLTISSGSPLIALLDSAQTWESDDRAESFHLQGDLTIVPWGSDREPTGFFGAGSSGPTFSSGSPNHAWCIAGIYSTSDWKLLQRASTGPPDYYQVIIEPWKRLDVVNVWIDDLESAGVPPFSTLQFHVYVKTYRWPDYFSAKLYFKTNAGPWVDEGPWEEQDVGPLMYSQNMTLIETIDDDYRVFRTIDKILIGWTTEGIQDDRMRITFYSLPTAVTQHCRNAFTSRRRHYAGEPTWGDFESLDGCAIMEYHYNATCDDFGAECMNNDCFEYTADFTYSGTLLRQLGLGLAEIIRTDLYGGELPPDVTDPSTGDRFNKSSNYGLTATAINTGLSSTGYVSDVEIQR